RVINWYVQNNDWWYTEKASSPITVNRKVTLRDLETESIGISIIKPDAYRHNFDRAIIKDLENLKKYGINILSIVERSKGLTQAQALGLYDVLEGKPYYPGMVASMTSGKSALIILDLGPGGYIRLADIVGDTEGKKEGTFRHKYGIEWTIYNCLVDDQIVQVRTLENRIHRSDSKDPFERVLIEINHVYTDQELSRLFEPAAVKYLKSFASSPLKKKANQKASNSGSSVGSGTGNSLLNPINLGVGCLVPDVIKSIFNAVVLENISNSIDWAQVHIKQQVFSQAVSPFRGYKEAAVDLLARIESLLGRAPPKVEEFFRKLLIMNANRLRTVNLTISSPNSQINLIVEKIQKKIKSSYRDVTGNDIRGAIADAGQSDDLYLEIVLEGFRTAERFFKGFWAGILIDVARKNPDYAERAVLLLNEHLREYHQKHSSFSISPIEISRIIEGYLSIGGEMGIKGLKQGLLYSVSFDYSRRALLKSSASRWMKKVDARVNMIRENLTQESFRRRGLYSHLDEAKFIFILESKLKRKLEFNEIEQAQSLIRELRKIRDEVGVLKLLNSMLANSGSPNTCISVCNRQAVLYKDLNIDYMSFVKMSFIDEISSFYAYDKRIDDFWNDYGEGNKPIHKYMAIRFLEVPLVVELAGDQFVMGEGVHEYVDIGIIIIPVEDLQMFDWPYVGGRRRLNVSSVQAEKLLSLVNHEHSYMDILIRESLRLHDLYKQELAGTSQEFLSSSPANLKLNFIPQTKNTIVQGPDFASQLVRASRAISSPAFTVTFEEDAANREPRLKDSEVSRTELKSAIEEAFLETDILTETLKIMSGMAQLEKSDISDVKIVFLDAENIISRVYLVTAGHKFGQSKFILDVDYRGVLAEDKKTAQLFKIHDNLLEAWKVDNSRALRPFAKGQARIKSSGTDVYMTTKEYLPAGWDNAYVVRPTSSDKPRIRSYGRNWEIRSEFELFMQEVVKTLILYYLKLGNRAIKFKFNHGDFMLFHQGIIDCGLKDYGDDYLAAFMDYDVDLEGGYKNVKIVSIWDFEAMGVKQLLEYFLTRKEPVSLLSPEKLDNLFSLEVVEAGMKKALSQFYGSSSDKNKEWIDSFNQFASSPAKSNFDNIRFGHGHSPRVTSSVAGGALSRARAALSSPAKPSAVQEAVENFLRRDVYVACHELGHRSLDFNGISNILSGFSDGSVIHESLAGLGGLLGRLRAEKLDIDASDNPVKEINYFGLLILLRWALDENSGRYSSSRLIFDYLGKELGQKVPYESSPEVLIAFFKQIIVKDLPVLLEAESQAQDKLIQELRSSSESSSPTRNKTILTKETVALIDRSFAVRETAEGALKFKDVPLETYSYYDLNNTGPFLKLSGVVRSRYQGWLLRYTRDLKRNNYYGEVILVNKEGKHAAHYKVSKEHGLLCMEGFAYPSMAGFEALPVYTQGEVSSPSKNRVEDLAGKEIQLFFAKATENFFEFNSERIIFAPFMSERIEKTYDVLDRLSGSKYPGKGVWYIVGFFDRPVAIVKLLFTRIQDIEDEKDRVIGQLLNSQINNIVKLANHYVGDKALLPTDDSLSFWAVAEYLLLLQGTTHEDFEHTCDIFAAATKRTIFGLSCNWRIYADEVLVDQLNDQIMHVTLRLSSILNEDEFVSSPVKDNEITWGRNPRKIESNTSKFLNRHIAATRIARGNITLDLVQSVKDHTLLRVVIEKLATEESTNRDEGAMLDILNSIVDSQGKQDSFRSLLTSLYRSKYTPNANFKKAAVKVLADIGFSKKYDRDFRITSGSSSPVNIDVPELAIKLMSSDTIVYEWRTNHGGLFVTGISEELQLLMIQELLKQKYIRYDEHMIVDLNEWPNEEKAQKIIIEKVRDFIRQGHLVFIQGYRNDPSLINLLHILRADHIEKCPDSKRQEHNVVIFGREAAKVDPYAKAGLYDVSFPLGNYPTFIHLVEGEFKRYDPCTNYTLGLPSSSSPTKQNIPDLVVKLMVSRGVRRWRAD
ncbi:MAG: hypothetical protein JW734_01970, partial [Candidatus Omnitrophica bacterium]|nr:hypothetical protein [Candidatus Omnitrophota bacterium]